MTSRTGTSDAHRAGFTFIELIFVALVLAILLVATAPRFRQTADRLQTERTAFELVQLLRYAHTVSVNESVAIQWRWDADERRVLLAAMQPDGSSVPLGGRWGRGKRIAESIELTITQGQPQAEGTVNFFPDGSSDQVSVVVSGPTRHHYLITVDASTSQVLLQPTGTAPR